MSIVGYRHTVDAAEVVATQDDGHAMGVRVHTVPDKFHDCAHWVRLMREQLHVIVGSLQMNTFHNAQHRSGVRRKGPRSWMTFKRIRDGLSLPRSSERRPERREDTRRRPALAAALDVDRPD